jgi:hypothetical protein
VTEEPCNGTVPPDSLILFDSRGTRVCDEGVTCLGAALHFKKHAKTRRRAITCSNHDWQERDSIDDSIVLVFWGQQGHH